MNSLKPRLKPRAYFCICFLANNPLFIISIDLKCDKVLVSVKGNGLLEYEVFFSLVPGFGHANFWALFPSASGLQTIDLIQKIINNTPWGWRIEFREITEMCNEVTESQGEKPHSLIQQNYSLAFWGGW